jgi:beta-glucosidase
VGWEVHPPALRRLLVRLHAGFDLPPLYLTENGAAFEDRVDPDGRIRDPRRQAYLRRHIVEMQRTMQAGVDVRGYFVWSLQDTFEWTRGYQRRFGIVHVDFATQERRIKDSGRWYRDLIAANAIQESR